MHFLFSKLSAFRCSRVVIAVLASSCDHSHDLASRSRLAVEKSNVEARRLFEIEPFKSEDGQLNEDGTAWEAVAASGRKSIISKIAFDDHGSVVKVDVKMLPVPTTAPVPDVGPSLEPDRGNQDKPPIPEVMPK